MRYLRVLALVGISLGSASYAHAQRVVIRLGSGQSYAGPPPQCAYGYYGYSPYSCAPYGYYGPEWFSNGYFIGAGPWFRSGYRRQEVRPDFDDREYGYGERRGYRRDYGRRGYEGRDFRDEENYRSRYHRGNGNFHERDYDDENRFRGRESRGGGWHKEHDDEDR